MIVTLLAAFPKTTLTCFSEYFHFYGFRDPCPNSQFWPGPVGIDDRRGCLSRIETVRVKYSAASVIEFLPYI